MINNTLQKKANATLVGSKPNIILFLDGCIKWAVQQEVLLILNCMHVAVLSHTLTLAGLHGRLLSLPT